MFKYKDDSEEKGLKQTRKSKQRNVFKTNVKKKQEKKKQNSQLKTSSERRTRENNLSQKGQVRRTLGE